MVVDDMLLTIESKLISILKDRISSYHSDRPTMRLARVSVHAKHVDSDKRSTAIYKTASIVFRDISGLASCATWMMCLWISYPWDDYHMNCGSLLSFTNELFVAYTSAKYLKIHRHWSRFFETLKCPSKSNFSYLVIWVPFALDAITIYARLNSELLLARESAAIPLFRSALVQHPGVETVKPKWLQITIFVCGGTQLLPSCELRW